MQAEALGDSIYETNIYVAGKVTSLGADCIEKKITKAHIEKINSLLNKGLILKNTLIKILKDMDRQENYIILK